MSSTGVCQIKSEYIIDAPQYTKPVDESNGNDDPDLDGSKIDTDESGEPDAKRPRGNKKKTRGQNKARPAPYKCDFTAQLCHKLVNACENEPIPECENEKCKALHNVDEYLKIKPAYIGDVCYNYEIQGICPRGLACRFGKSHISSNGKNIKNVEVAEKYKPETSNILPMDLQWALRKRTYDFTDAENAVKEYDRTKGSKQLNEERVAERKTIDWKDKLLLSPLTTVGNLPFRRICKEFGADITCGEMAMGVSLLQGANQEWALVKRHKSEDIFGVQLCGNNPHTITKTAQILQDKMDVDFIDLNLGCPIDLVFKEGAGCGLLRRERVLEAIISCTSSLLKIPLTVKTRTGVHSDHNVAHKLIPKFAQWGASMVTLHGRSREQRYTRSANWDYINECAGLAAPMPVFGNGDILSYNDYKHVRETYPNVSGVTIGRGALIKPWIFTEIKEQRLWDIRSNERFDILKKYANYGLEHWGSDTRGVENTRRFMLEWLSFLYRYIPVGVLESPPQKINERPPYYKGRDDLETLMASPNCTDWIKISEMLLGPVPDGFNFLPKHKANSYA